MANEIYLPLVLAAREAGVPVESVIEVALQRFAGLSLQEKIDLMYRFHFAPGSDLTKASLPATSKPVPHFAGEALGTVLRKKPWHGRWADQVKRVARLTLSWLLRC